MNDIYTNVNRYCPADYKVNEIIKFAHPFRRIKVKLIVNKQPEKSIQQIYSVLLESIIAGFDTNKDLCRFLGLKKDDFILRELFFLRDKDFVNFIDQKWFVTESGENYIQKNETLTILEEDEFEFLIDAISGRIIEYTDRLQSNVDDAYKLPVSINYQNRDSKLLDNHESEIMDLYSSINKKKAYIIEILKNKITFDDVEYQDYYLIEYIPISAMLKDNDPYVEIRNFDNSKNKELSSYFNHSYPEFIDKLTSSERSEFQENVFEYEEEYENTISFIKSNKDILTVWETKDKFIEALKNTKSRILIESPWIKRATCEYIPYIEKLLKDSKQVFLLYGIDQKDEHHFGTIRKLERLEKQYKTLKLIHLPSHFEEVRLNKTGTHRKLVIKDNEYFILGSFNFLSFNKKEGERVANEESIIVSTGTKEKWSSVFGEYAINMN